MKIHCKYDALIKLKDLKPHPKNRNKHSKEQIERLVKLYSFHGIRHPIIVSNLSGFIVAGHGRLAAAKEAGMQNFPVVRQDFDSDSAEYAFLQADNAIALWAELDLEAIKLDLPQLEDGFEIDVLGIKNFVPYPVNFNEPDQKSDPTLKEPQLKLCPNCGVVIE